MKWINLISFARIVRVSSYFCGEQYFLLLCSRFSLLSLSLFLRRYRPVKTILWSKYSTFTAKQSKFALQTDGDCYNWKITSRLSLALLVCLFVYWHQNLLNWGHRIGLIILTQPRHVCFDANQIDVLMKYGVWLYCVINVQPRLWLPCLISQTRRRTRLCPLTSSQRS